MQPKIFICLLFTFSFYCLAAQVCTGVPGDTLVLLTFGSGDNPGPALPSGTTTYNFGSIGGGNYVVTNTSGINGGLWHHAPDHSDDTNGYMLLFDASSAPGIFFQSIVDGLCPNTTYEFGCWATNIVQPFACGGSSIQPNITFEVRHPFTNELLASVSTGPIPTSANSVWDDYGVTFTLPSNLSSVRVVMVNNAPGGCGNDLAIDDIVFRICNPFHVQKKKICDGDSVVVGNSVYKTPGAYQDQFKVAGTCNDSVVFTVVEKGDFVEQKQFYTLCPGEFVVANGTVYNVAGIYHDTLAASPNALCDTLVQVEIQMLEFVRDTQYVGLCFGDEIFISGNLYDEAGIYTDTVEAPGCDKILVSIITEDPLPVVNRYYHFCEGEDLIVDGQWYPQPGIYKDTLVYPGCDTALILHIEKHQHSFTAQERLLCEGERFTVGNKTYATDGIYLDTLVNAYGCDSIVSSVLRFNRLSLSLRPDFVRLDMAESLQLDGAVSSLYPPAPRWMWTPQNGLSCADCPDPWLTASFSGYYRLWVEDTLSGCTAEDSLYLEVLPCKRIYIPNVFQPEQETENGNFTLYAAPCVRLINKMHVYDRWGDLIFEKLDFPPNDPKSGWKGEGNKHKSAPSGVYAYVFWLELFNGESQVLYGDVSLLR